MDTKDLFPGEPLAIPLEFLYEVSYKARSWVNERKELFVGSTTLELATADLAGMPVVYRIKAPTPQYSAEDHPFSKGDWVDVRFHENRFYVEHGTLRAFLDDISQGRPDATPLSTLLTPNQRLKQKAKVNGELVDVERGHEIHDLKSLHRKETGIKFVEDDNGEAKAREIADYASELLVADGRVFRAVSEPVLHLSTHDATIVESTQQYLHSRYRFLHATEAMLPLSRIDEIPAQLLRRGAIEAEVLRPDLAVVEPDIGLLVHSVAEMAKKAARYIHEMPREWGVALARLNRALDGSPLHPTRRIADALEEVAALRTPGAAEISRLKNLYLRTRARHEGNYSQIVDDALASVADFRRKAPALSKAAETFLETMALADRCDHAFTTVAAGERPENVGARARPARSGSDLLVAAEMAGVSYASLVERLSADEGLDVFLVEARWSDAPSPGEWVKPSAVAIYDRETREVVERHVAKGRFAARSEAVLEAHAASLAEREPEFSRERGLTP